MNREKEEFPPRGRGIYLLPNLFTLTALFAGFYAIVAAMRGDFDSASVATFIAMIMDTLDGRVARLTHTQTAFGAQLDSLSDMVCFGIAPSLIAYVWGLGLLGKAGWLMAFVYTVAVALRLARFNTQLDILDKRFFIGLPCPAGAAVIISGIWSIHQYGLSNSHLMHLVIAALMGITSLLMVSNFRYYSFKTIHLKHKVPFIAILAAVLIFVLIAVDPPIVLFLLFFVFALSGPVYWIIRQRNKWNLKNKSKPT